MQAQSREENKTNWSMHILSLTVGSTSPNKSKAMLERLSKLDVKRRTVEDELQQTQNMSPNHGRHRREYAASIRQGKGECMMNMYENMIINDISKVNLRVFFDVLLKQEKVPFCGIVQPGKDRTSVASAPFMSRAGCS